MSNKVSTFRKLAPRTVLSLLTVAVATLTLAQFSFAQDDDEEMEPEVTCKPAIRTEVKKNLTATPEIVNQGKTLFMNNCVACHGPDGKAATEASLAMNPRPRNLTAEKYKNGTSPLAIFGTLTNGLGNYMPAFENLKPEQRYALAHYVRSLRPADKLEKVTDEQIEAVCLDLSRPPKPPSIPIELAMTILLEEQGKTRAKTARKYGNVKFNNGGSVEHGKDLYTAACASCHGDSAQGMSGLGKYGRYPFIELSTGNLSRDFAGGNWSQFAERTQAVHYTVPTVNTLGSLNQYDWKSVHRFMSTLTGTAKVEDDTPPPPAAPVMTLLTVTKEYDLFTQGKQVFKREKSEEKPAPVLITSFEEFAKLYKVLPTKDGEAFKLPATLPTEGLKLPTILELECTATGCDAADESTLVDAKRGEFFLLFVETTP